MAWAQTVAAGQAQRTRRIASSAVSSDMAKIAGLKRAPGTVVKGSRGACGDGALGIIEGTPPAFGYGYGRAAMVDPRLPASFPLSSYDPELYGADSHAQLEGYHLGSFWDTIQNIVGGVTNAATKVENIARGVSTASQATQYVTQRAAAGGGTVFQPSPADVAAKNLDVASLLGGNYTTAFLIGGGLLIFLLARRR